MIFQVAAKPSRKRTPRFAGLVVIVRKQGERPVLAFLRSSQVAKILAIAGCIRKRNPD
jgi:hypothetical protein